MRRLGAILAIVIVAPPAGAQLIATGESCDRSIAAVEGAPLPDPGTDRFVPWQMVAVCGARGDSAAARTVGLATFRAETDTNRVDAFLALFRAHRSRILFAALRAAATSSATQMVKLRVVQALGVTWEPLYEFELAALTQPDAMFCAYRPQTFPSVGSRADLPSDALQQVLSTMQSVEASSANLAEVRGLARCWRTMLERTGTPDGKHIKMKHVCANTFRIDNDNAQVVQVSIAVEGTIETHTFEVMPRSGREVSTLNAGHVRLLFRGAQVDRKHTANNKC